MSRSQAIALAAAMTAICAAILGYNAHLYHKQHQTAAFPRTDGVVLENTVAGGLKSRTWRLDVRYTVDGRTYHTRRATYVWGIFSRRVFSEFRPTLKVGDTVPVYYNPDAPDQAVLIPGLQYHQFLVYGWTAAIMLAFLILAWWSALSTPKTPHAQSPPHPRGTQTADSN